MLKILRRSLSLALAFMLLASLTVGGGILYANADDKTGDGLAAYAMTAYNEGWSYVWGGASYGAVDCSGLIYSYVGGGARVTEDQLYSSPESGYVSDGVPDIPGLGLWQPGHVGVYVGGGMAVDARDEISNVCYQSVSTKNWVMWFKVAGVSYGTNSSVTNSDQSNAVSNSDSLTKKPEKADEEEDETLSYGSTGRKVNELQERLKTLGYFTDDTTEYFGSVTQGALAQFQMNAGLYVTGIYDAATKKALEASDAPAKPVSAPTSDKTTEAEEPEFIEDTEEQTDEIEEPLTDSEQSSVESDEDEQDVDVEPEETDTAAESDTLDEEDADSEQSSANGEDDAEASDAVYKLGDEDAEISDIQYILIKLGYFDYNITGSFCENTADAVQSFRNDYGLGDERYLDNETIDAVYSVYNGTYGSQTVAKAALYESIAADTDDTEEDSAAASSEQSVTVTAVSTDAETSTEEDKPEAEKSDEKKPEETASEAPTAAAGTAKAESSAKPAVQKSSENVVFVQTGAEDIFTTNTLLAVVGISLVVIFFAGTIRYWNVSMEKRKQRARRATTVSVYRRSSM